MDSQAPVDIIAPIFTVAMQLIGRQGKRGSDFPRVKRTGLKSASCLLLFSIENA
jgi:hypothetical protein